MSTFSYTKDEDGKLIADENEANGKNRRILSESTRGKVLGDIAMDWERQIRTGGKRYKWHLSTGYRKQIYG